MNKILGLIVVGVAGLAALMQLSLLISVYPKLSTLYQDFGANIPLLSSIYPAIALVIIVVYIYIISIGVKLFKTKEHNQKLFTKGIIGLVVVLLTFSLATGISVLSLISPIYSLSNSF